MKKAFLIVDLQNDYFPGGLFPLRNTDAVLANIKEAIAPAQENKEAMACFVLARRGRGIRIAGKMVLMPIRIFGGGGMAGRMPASHRAS